MRGVAARGNASGVHRFVAIGHFVADLRLPLNSAGSATGGRPSSLPPPSGSQRSMEYRGYGVCPRIPVTLLQEGSQQRAQCFRHRIPERGSPFSDKKQCIPFISSQLPLHLSVLVHRGVDAIKPPWPYLRV
jgi:hypothetical protein